MPYLRAKKSDWGAFWNAAEVFETPARMDSAKLFTPHGATAIGEAIEKGLGNRKGERTGLAAMATTSGGKTVDLAAKRAGFKSAGSCRRAQRTRTS
jgi:hypothetical protein